jgi:hypothetical protein
MVIDVLGVVTRGAEPGTRSCDGCRRIATELRECRVPYSTTGGGRAMCYWRDLCRECLETLRSLPLLPKGGKATADAAWDAALRELRP